MSNFLVVFSDAIRLYYPDSTTNVSTQVMFLTPALTPWASPWQPNLPTNNPSLRLFEFDDSNYEISDYWTFWVPILSKVQSEPFNRYFSIVRQTSLKMLWRTPSFGSSNTKPAKREEMFPHSCFLLLAFLRRASFSNWKNLMWLYFFFFSRYPLIAGGYFSNATDMQQIVTAMQQPDSQLLQKYIAHNSVMYPQVAALLE